MRILRYPKSLSEKLLPILLIPCLVLGTFLLTGLLMAITGSALSALALVLVIIVIITLWEALKSDDAHQY